MKKRGRLSGPGTCPRRSPPTERRGSISQGRMPRFPGFARLKVMGCQTHGFPGGISPGGRIPHRYQEPAVRPAKNPLHTVQPVSSLEFYPCKRLLRVRSRRGHGRASHGVAFCAAGRSCAACT